MLIGERAGPTASSREPVPLPGQLYTSKSLSPTSLLDKRRLSPTPTPPRQRLESTARNTGQLAPALQGASTAITRVSASNHTVQFAKGAHSKAGGRESIEGGIHMPSRSVRHRTRLPAHDTVCLMRLSVCHQLPPRQCRQGQFDRAAFPGGPAASSLHSLQQGSALRRTTPGAGLKPRPDAGRAP